MFLKKICIFLTCVFLAVDIFLLTLYIEANLNLKMLSDKMVGNTVGYYKSIGVEIDESAIVRKVPDNKIYTFSSDNSSVAMKSAERIIDKLFSGNAQVSVVETPEGHSYAISHEGTTAASLRVYGKSFEIEYVSGGFVVESFGLYLEPFENSSKSSDAEAFKLVESFVTALSGESTPLYKVAGVYNMSDRLIVCLKIMIDEECFIDGSYLNVVVENGKVVYAKGNIILSDITRRYSEPLYDGINALNKVDSSLVSKFLSEEIVYTQRYAGNGVYYLIPVWKIEYVDVDGRTDIQYIDAIKK